MDESELDDKLKEVLKYIAEWLRFAEAKNGAVVGLNVVAIFGAVRFFDNPNGSYLIYLLGLSIGGMSLSLLISLASFFPSTKILLIWLKRDNSMRSDGSILFFSDIVRHSPRSYLQAIASLNREYSKLELDYAKQIISLSKIAQEKFSFFKVSLCCTFIAWIFFIISIIVKWSI